PVPYSLLLVVVWVGILWLFAICYFLWAVGYLHSPGDRQYFRGEAFAQISCHFNPDVYARMLRP
ncbi:hypothetical protein, partial [Planktothricoides sp. SR001]|uniref:hypothetical protein n=1 Tax=Planktothricoides sp. SR001 TaxID=1705388 RepID=UPI001E3968D5